MIFIGIDPGLSGAVAAIDDFGDCLYIGNTPTQKVTVSRKERTAYDIGAMAATLRGWADDPHMVVLEITTPMPRSKNKRGAIGDFKMGEGIGVWQGILGALLMRYKTVHPAAWKRKMGLIGKGKGDSILLAKQLFPRVDLPLKKDHGKAEALLLAEYGRREYGLVGEK